MSQQLIDLKAKVIKERLTAIECPTELCDLKAYITHLNYVQEFGETIMAMQTIGGIIEYMMEVEEYTHDDLAKLFEVTT
jgi:hypothetical protein